jgi:hypothetical protein
MSHFVTVWKCGLHEVVGITGVYHTREEAEAAIRERSIDDGVMFEEVKEIDNEEDEQ